MGNILKGFGYGIAVLLIIAGIALFAVDFETAMFGIVLIIIGIIIIWAIRRSGQGSRMQETDSRGYDTTKECPTCHGQKFANCTMCNGTGRGGISVCGSCNVGKILCSRC